MNTEQVKTFLKNAPNYSLLELYQETKQCDCDWHKETRQSCLLIDPELEDKLKKSVKES